MGNIVIKKIEKLDELKRLIQVFTLAFETEYNTTDKYLENMLANKNMLTLAAFLEDEVIGGLVAFEMTPIHGTKELYIYDIAVHPKKQKQGVGSKLLDQLKLEAKEIGVGTIFVEAEADDTGAVAFYRAIGGEEIPVSHFNFNLE